MNENKKLFPLRPIHKGEDGTKVCDLCPLSTKGQAVGIFFDRNRPIGDQTVRGHLGCAQQLLELTSHWGIQPPKHQSTFIEGDKDEDNEEAVD